MRALPGGSSHVPSASQQKLSLAAAQRARNTVVSRCAEAMTDARTALRASTQKAAPASSAGSPSSCRMTPVACLRVSSSNKNLLCEKRHPVS